jgi:hypothetical protein
VRPTDDKNAPCYRFGARAGATVWRFVAAFLGLFFVISLPNGAEAENCWMIGCAGQIGYVFLPVPVYYPSNGEALFSLNRHPCSGPSPTEDRPFGTAGLPEVNSVVALADNVRLLTQEEIETHLGSFQGVSLRLTADGSECEAAWRPPVDAGGEPMRAGATLKILGYRTFVSQTSWSSPGGISTSHEQLLFALVLVENDG